MSASRRLMVDDVGFATRPEQMRAILDRIDALHGLAAVVPTAAPTRVAVCPHDDYTYVGGLYPSALAGVSARTVILIGVAHKARALGLEDVLLFESFERWAAPFGDVQVSPLRAGILERLSADVRLVHDEMHAIEHSLEAIVPFLQASTPDLSIVPLLVPAMAFERMDAVATPLAMAIASVLRERSLRWGEDVAIVISNDAVHYGDEEWGGRDFARFGTGESGYREAVAYEHRIIEECLIGELAPERIRRFTEHTVSADDHREYRWTWCGRYAVPCGLLVAWHLSRELGMTMPYGTLAGYGTSVDGRPRIPVDDLGMGTTAPATLRHWVGYAGVRWQ